MIVDLFIPCYVDQLMPQTAWNMIRLLESIGCAVNYNPEQTCCGHPAYEAGYWDDSREVAQKFIAEFTNERYILLPTLSCIDFVKKRYSEMFANSSSLNEMKMLQKNMYEFTDFVVNVLKISQLGSINNKRVALIDFCRCSANTNYAEALLQKVKGIELVKIENECCGFGGMFTVKYQTISTEMTKQLVDKIQLSGAEIVVGIESACIMQIQSYLSEQSLPIKAMSVIDFMAESLH